MVYNKDPKKRIKYQGHWLNGVFQGLGEMRFEDGSSYNGEWLSGKQHGLGVYRFSFGGSYKKYKGEFSRG